jgi:hypothetical protein
MKTGTRIAYGLAFALPFSLAAAVEARVAEKIVLDRAIIVADSAEPSFVQYGVKELAGFLKDVTGNEIRVVNSPGETNGVRIVVGTQAAGQIVSEGLPDPGAGEEAYVLRCLTKADTVYVIAAGGTPRGTKAALAALVRAIGVEGKSAFLPASLNVATQPAVPKRGMHFNGWAFNAPYSFRAWREEDWQRYLDILAYQGVNLFYLWPFIEIMPVPLSPEDREYLEECRRVVDYAQKRHGMEVWIMQCTNRVARDRCGVADPRRRPYWRSSQEDLDPGRPEHLQAILASREAMYRIIDNADGVCNIDSDPGYCPDSPLSDYLKVLNGCRELLDKHNIHGKQAKLIHWMWQGWGCGGAQPGKPEDRHQAAIQGLKQNLPEPWWLVAGWGEMLKFCRDENTLGKTVLLPYGTIEDEPSYPATNLQIDGLRQQFDAFAAKNPELAGVMGNVQTPLLQFPDVYYFTSAMFDAEYRKRPEKQVLLDLAGYLYPEHRQLIADCYLALNEQDPAKIQALADVLDKLIRENKLGSDGLFGRKLFPDHRIVAQSLVLQLRFRAATRRLAQAEISPSTPQQDCIRLLCDYFDGYLAWDNAHGWHGLWGWDSWPLDTPPTVLEKLAVNLGEVPAVGACLDAVARTLSAKYDKKAVEEGCVGPLKKAVLGHLPIKTLAQEAKATASVVPKPEQYPPSAAVDGKLGTLYWPGALVKNNTEWLQLTWDKPRTFDRIIVRFLKHPSMVGRTIHLQKEISPGKWEDVATTAIAADRSAPNAVATFQLPTRVTLDKIRIVNLLDVFEVEVY